jgi:hypothetical protein
LKKNANVNKRSGFENLTVSGQQIAKLFADLSVVHKLFLATFSINIIFTPVKGLTQVREALSESNIPFLVDIHDWSRLPDSFRRQILKKYVVVLEDRTG